MNDTIEYAKTRLEELIAYFGINTETTSKETEDGIELDIEPSASTPRLIGHHGETLRALEYIINQMVRHHDPSAPRISVDVAGYRQARREQLEQMARDVAKRVSESGEEEELKPMNPAERRIVHMVLRDIPEVATESRGTDRTRHIVVMPAE